MTKAELMKERKLLSFGRFPPKTENDMNLPGLCIM